MRLLVVLLALVLAFPAYAGGLYPPGFTIFCEENPAECEPREPAVLPISEWESTLRSINDNINQSIAYRPDPNTISLPDLNELYERVGRGDVPQGDKWTIAPEYGDCDDYAVTKYMRLIETGVPRGALRFAYVLPHKDEPHLFLIAETTSGPMVLDSRIPRMIGLERYPLDRLSLQSETNPIEWRQVY